VVYRPSVHGLSLKLMVQSSGWDAALANVADWYS
jgi:hypothetical protein